MEKRQKRRHDQRRLANVDNVGYLIEQYATERETISENLMENMSADFKKNIECGKMQLDNTNLANLNNRAKVKAKSGIKINASDLFSVDTTNLPQLLFSYPSLNDIQRFRLRIAVRSQVDKLMENFKCKLDRQLLQSKKQGLISAVNNETRRRTALMVYRQRNIDMAEVEKDAYVNLTKSTELISKLFQPDPNDKLKFSALSAKNKWKRVYKEKHWKAYTKDPNKSRRKNKNGDDLGEDNYHNFRINLPLRKPDIKKWASKHSIARGVNNKTIAKPLPDDEGKTEIAQKYEPYKETNDNITTNKQKSRRQTHFETHGRYLYNTQYLPEDYLPNLKKSSNVLNHYGGFDDDKSKEKTMLIKKIANARFKKYGTLDTQHTLISWKMKTSSDLNKQRSFNTSKFMSPDLVVKPFVPIDRIDDHVKSISALPMTCITSSETFNIQNRRRANSMENIYDSMIIKPVVKRAKTWEEEHLVESDEDEKDNENVEPKIVNLSTMLSKHNHNSKIFLGELHKFFNVVIKDESVDYKHKLLERNIQAAKLTNPLWKMQVQAQFKQKPEFGEYPLFLYKLSGVTENEIYNFKNYLQNIIFTHGDTYDQYTEEESHRTAIESVSYSLMVTVSTQNKLNENTYTSIIPKRDTANKQKQVGNHNKHVIVPLNPITLGKFKDAIKLLGLSPVMLLKIVCKYTNPKFSPWATLASDIWLRCCHALTRLKKSCQQYTYIKSRMPKVKRKKHLFVLSTQMHLINQEKEECDRLKYFVYLSFSDYIIAGILQESVTKEIANLEEEEEDVSAIEERMRSKGGLLHTPETTVVDDINYNNNVLSNASATTAREFVVSKAEKDAINLEEKSIEKLMNLS